MSGDDIATSEPAGPATTATTSTTDTTPDSTGDEGPVEAAPHVFPDVDVVDLASGSTVSFGDAVGGGSLPVLIWFYAPH